MAGADELLRHSFYQLTMKKNSILISVDVEEFDIPEEYGHVVSKEEKLHVSYRGLLNTLALFDELNIRATFFITAYWAQQFPEVVKRIAAKHEIASHTFYHSSFREEDLLASRLELEKISDQRVLGFRMPRLQPVSLHALAHAGYLYDASLNPTWLPGRYNNRHMPRTVHRNGPLWVMPSSVTPVFRIPVFWLSVKNFPLWFTRSCISNILRHDDYFSFYFHPWELEDLSAYQLPWYVKRKCGEQLYERLYHLFNGLKKKGEFISHGDYLQLHSSGRSTTFYVPLS